VVEDGNLTETKRRIEAGENLEQTNSWGATPLYLAVLNSHKSLVEYLVAKGARVNISTTGKESWTPLHKAADLGQLDVVKLLLEKGADLEAKTQWGGTPLYVTAFRGQLEVAKYLVSKGADINIVTTDGWTPLTKCAELGHIQLAKFFINQGVDIWQKTQYGATAMERAVQTEQQAMVSFLRPYYSKPEQKDEVKPALPNAGQKQPPSIVAVFDVETKGVKLKKDFIDGLSSLLAMKLAEHGNYKVVPRDSLKARLAEQKTESYKVCYDQNCQIELGRELAAEKTLSCQIIKLGSQCSITVALYDLKSAATEKAATASSGCQEDNLVSSLGDLVKKVALQTR
jgi:ankyrin repeat protein